MNRHIILYLTGIICLLPLLFHLEIAKAYGYNFVFPGGWHAPPSSYKYEDNRKPNHRAWGFGFYAHTKVVAAKEGDIDDSLWDYDLGHEPDCIGYKRDRGNYIELDHQNGLETWYFHLSRLGRTPAIGTPLAMGEYMAYSGDTGCGGYHLHFETRMNNVPFDPYAGVTQWVSGEPIPMGYRDPNGKVYGPFALDNATIRDKWLALGGGAGSPISDN